MDEREKLLEQAFEAANSCFDQGDYQNALEMWKKCLELDAYQEDIINILHQCFIDPNRDEYEKIYQEQRKECTFIGEFSYEERSKDSKSIIFVNDTTFYLLDEKRKRISDPVVLERGEEELQLEDYQIRVLFEIPELELVKKHLKGVSGVYWILNQETDMFAYLKIPGFKKFCLEKVVFFSSQQELQDYFTQHQELPLPKRVIGTDAKVRERIQEGLRALHDGRIKSGSREYIFLSIYIPSYNRGSLAWDRVQELTSWFYDSEIEIIVSNNGSQKGKEYYEKIRSLAEIDNRVVYHEFEENQFFDGNFWKGLDLARGQWILYLSDEDSLNEEVIPYYMYKLRDSNNLGMARGRISIEASEIEIYRRKGTSELVEDVMSNNYVSGGFYCTNIIDRTKISQLREKNKDNESLILYPHICLELFLADKYDYWESNIPLFFMGDSADGGDWEDSNKFKYGKYSGVESRIRQLYGWADILNQIKYENDNSLIELCFLLCQKTFFLIRLIKDVIDDWPDACKRVVEASAEIYDNLACSEGLLEVNRESFVDLVMKEFETNLVED